MLALLRLCQKTPQAERDGDRSKNALFVIPFECCRGRFAVSPGRRCLNSGVSSSRRVPHCLLCEDGFGAAAGGRGELAHWMLTRKVFVSPGGEARDGQEREERMDRSANLNGHPAAQRRELLKVCDRPFAP